MSSTPPTSPAEPIGRDGAEVLSYLRDRDVACPACGYNLRDLTRPVCPECREALRLTVGLQDDAPIVWFVATLAPSIFSGIAAILLLFPIVLVPLTGGGAAPWPALAIDAFGLSSGVAGLFLLRSRRAFTRRPVSAQRMWAAAAWIVHVTPFFALVALTFFL